MPAFDPRRLAPLAEKYGRRYKAETLLFREGDEAGEFFVVLRGTVEITKSYPDSSGGRTIQFLDLLGPGDIFGEMAEVGGSPRFATARATADLEVLALPTGEFERLVTKHSEFTMTVVRSLFDRLRSASSRPRVEAPGAARSRVRRP